MGPFALCCLVSGGICVVIGAAAAGERLLAIGVVIALLAPLVDLVLGELPMVALDGGLILIGGTLVCALVGYLLRRKDQHRRADHSRELHPHRRALPPAPQQPEDRE